MRVPLLDNLPRAKPVKRMHVLDAGENCIQFLCGHCGHDTGWLVNEWTLSEAKRGIPCPTCNPSIPGSTS